MNASYPSQKHATTPTLNVALWVIGGVFLAQFGAVAWAVFGSGQNGRFASFGPRGLAGIDTHQEIGDLESGLFPDGSDPDALLIPPGSRPVPALPGTSPDPATEKSAGTASIPPIGSPDTIPLELGGTARARLKTGSSLGAFSRDPVTSGTLDEPFYILPASARIRDPEVLGTIQAALKMRKDGDTQGALESLRRADALRPNNPRIFHEIATTYFHMGLTDKANAYWERVRTMGESGAGDYFALAEIHLGSTANALSGDPITPKDPPISIGDVIATRDTAERNGERIFVRIPIKSLPGIKIDPRQVKVYIYFYDLVDGTNIQETTSLTDVTQSWSSAPIDWLGSEPETLDVIYFQRFPAPGLGAASANRRYHGYLIRLFYQNTLQDVVANPRTLSDSSHAGDRQDDPDFNPQLDDALFGGS